MFCWHAELPASPCATEKRDRDELDRVLNGGIQPVRVALRSLALCQLHDGKSISEVADNVHLTSKAVREIGRRYEHSGLGRALYDKQRPGVRSLLDTKQRQRIIATVSSDPPQGRARWTVRLIAEKAVQRGLVPKVGRETIRVLLLSREFKPWRKKMLSCAGINRYGVENETASREKSSDPLGPVHWASSEV